MCSEVSLFWPTPTGFSSPEATNLTGKLCIFPEMFMFMFYINGHILNFLLN